MVKYDNLITNAEFTRKEVISGVNDEDIFQKCLNRIYKILNSMANLEKEGK